MATLQQRRQPRQQQQQRHHGPRAIIARRRFHAGESSPRSDGLTGPDRELEGLAIVGYDG